MAQLRATTGCRNCRLRRKKCDEQKPDCEACRRRNLKCHWPAADRIDGRRHHRIHASGDQSRPNSSISAGCSVDNEAPREVFSRPTEFVPGPEFLLDLQASLCPANAGIGIPQEDLSFLYQYCLKVFLPCQYHQPGFIAITDLSYSVFMCLNHSFLRDALMANAFNTMTVNLDKWQDAALKKYFSAVEDVGLAMSDGRLAGHEDELLEVAIWLCIFENSHLQSGRHIRIHLKAISKFLLLRTPVDREKSSHSVLSWERRCVESFLYHCAVAMLYLDDLDLYATASQVQEKYTASVLPNPDLRAEDLIELREFFLRSPSLGGPPDIFFAVIQGTQLARLTRPLTMEEYFVASSHYHRVQEWELKLDSIESQVDDQNLWMAKPYSLAVRVLILIVLTSNAPANDPRRQQLVSTLKEASAFLGKMEHYFHRTWGKYLLWPLAVLGATFTEPDELNEIRRLFDKMVARSNSSTILPVRRVLEDQIWSRQTEEGSSFRAQGIPSLFNCKLMAETAENLLQEASLAHASMLSTFMARLSSLNH